MTWPNWPVGITAGFFCTEMVLPIVSKTVCCGEHAGGSEVRTVRNVKCKRVC